MGADTGVGALGWVRSGCTAGLHPEAIAVRCARKTYGIACARAPLSHLRPLLFFLPPARSRCAAASCVFNHSLLRRVVPGSRVFMRSDTGSKLVKFFNEEARTTRLTHSPPLRQAPSSCLFLSLHPPVIPISPIHAELAYPPLLRRLLLQDERWHVHGVFHRFVANGEAVAIDRAVSHTYAPVYAEQTGMTFQIFSTTSTEPARCRSRLQLFLSCCACCGTPPPAPTGAACSGWLSID